MSKKTLNGQLNMFDFFGGFDNGGEVEMVSLMPEAKSSKSQPDFFSELDEVMVVESNLELENKPEPESELEPEPETEAQPRPEAQSIEVAELQEKPEVQEELASVEPLSVNPVRYSRDTKTVMHKEKTDSKGKVVSYISYIDYNTVVLQRKGEKAVTFNFETSKEAVDFYVDEMIKL